MPTACKLKNALRGVSQMSQVLKGRSGVRYSGGMNTAPEEDEQEAAKADPLARLLQCHPETAFDYLEFRRMMAGPAAAFAAERATARDIERLGACMRWRKRTSLTIRRRKPPPTPPFTLRSTKLRTIRC